MASPINDRIVMNNELTDDLLEEQKYKNWIRSLKLSGDTSVKFDLIADCQSLLLLRIFERLRPGILDWKKIEINPNNKYKKLANLSLFMAGLKEVKFEILSIGSMDIVDGDRHAIFSILWYFMRVFYMEHVTGKNNCNDQEIIEWAENFKQGLLNCEVCETDEIVSGPDRELIYEDGIQISIFDHWYSSQPDETTKELDADHNEVDISRMPSFRAFDPNSELEDVQLKIDHFYCSISPLENAQQKDSESEGQYDEYDFHLRLLSNIAEFETLLNKRCDEGDDLVDENKQSDFKVSESNKNFEDQQTKNSPEGRQENTDSKFENENDSLVVDLITKTNEEETNGISIDQTDQSSRANHTIENNQVSIVSYSDHQNVFFCARHKLPLAKATQEQLYKFIVAQKVNIFETKKDHHFLAEDLAKRIISFKKEMPQENSRKIWRPIADTPENKAIISDAIKAKLRSQVPLKDQASTKAQLGFMTGNNALR